jgi:endonuclease YncB( thermonuclease family)
MRPILAPAAVVALILITAAPEVSARCEPGPHAGPVTHVRDGDTIEVAGLPVRLQGLAAPESDQQGGAEATRAMRAFAAAAGEVRCELTGERSHDRCIGTCYLDGRDLAAALVVLAAMPLT